MRAAWMGRVMPLMTLLVLGGCTVARTGTGEPARSPLRDPTGEAMNQLAPEHFKVLFETTRGDFVVEVQREWAPLGAHRFYNLVRHGYYDGTYIFRVVPGFMAQFGIHGEPEISAAWNGATFPDERVAGSNGRGWMSFATSGPDTRTMQLFVNLVDNPFLDARGFSPFAWVVGGMDVVDRLYGGYGEATPRGRGPVQSRIFSEGNAYLEREFPQLDQVVRARIVTP
jgi:peptidyl-prolyl cis-trans isomerase A (cyclophilin A)